MKRYLMSYMSMAAFLIFLISGEMRFAHAYNIRDRCVGSNEPSWKKNEEFYELCNNPWVTLPQLLDGETRNHTAARKAMMAAFESWGFDGVSSYQSFVVPGNCRSGEPDGGWFDGDGRTLGTGISEMWYESGSVVIDICTKPNAAACAGQLYHCGVQREIRSADIVVGLQTFPGVAADRAG